MTLTPDLVLRLDRARMDGASHEDILTALEQAGAEDPVAAMKEYAMTPMPDGRLRAQVNLGDPAEWDA